MVIKYLENYSEKVLPEKVISIVDRDKLITPSSSKEFKLI